VTTPTPTPPVVARVPPGAGVVGRRGARDGVTPPDGTGPVSAAAQVPAAGPPEAATAVELVGVTKSYGSRRVVDGVDLVVPAGRVHALLGPNGAGKTTLLRMLLGLTRPDAGSVRLLGGDLEDARRQPVGGLAGFVDDPRFHPYLSGRRALRLLADLDGPPASGSGAATAAVRVERALGDAGLATRADEQVGTCSLGMRQRLGLAAALLREPGVLVLDEPANGLDPAGADELWATVRRLAAAGTAVVLSSHDLAAVDTVADDVTVLRSGSVVWSGALDVLRAWAPAPEHRLVSTDDDAAARVVAAVHGRVTAATATAMAAATAPAALDAVPGGGPSSQAGLLIRAERDELTAVTVALGRAGVGILSLTPGASPLRSLFAALTTGVPPVLPPTSVAPAPGVPAPGAPASVVPASVAPPRGARPQPAPGTGPGTADRPGGHRPRGHRPPAHPPRRLFAAACRTELSRLARQARVRGLLVVCLLAPFAFAAVVAGAGTLPADTLYGRWLRESAAAEPLVVLAFAASWAFPLLGSVVAGDLLSAEDRLGTWPTLLTRSVDRGTLLAAKAVVGAACAVAAVVVLATSSTLAGRLLAGRTPLIGLSGQLIGPAAADRLVLAAWAGSVPTVLAWTAAALVLSAWTRSGIVGIAGPAVLGVLGQLATLVDGPPVLRQLLLSSTLEGWHGLAEIPAEPRQLVTAVLVASAWTLVLTALLAAVVGRRAAVDAVGAGRGRGGA